MSFGDIPTTTTTSGMEPFRILFDGFQPLALTDRGVTRGFFLSVAGVVDRHPNFIVYLIVRFYLRSVDDTRVYIFIYRLYIYIYIYIYIYTDWCHLLGGRRAEM